MTAFDPSFFEYMSKRRHEKSAVGDLADDLMHDVWVHCPISESGNCEIPEPTSLESLVHFLREHGACEDAMNAAARAWADYQKYLGNTVSYARRLESAA